MLGRCAFFQRAHPHFHLMVRWHIPDELKEMVLSTSLQVLCDSEIHE